MKYKGYELLKAIADGEIKEGSKVIAPNDIQYTYNGIAFKDENGNFMNEEFLDREYAIFDFELIEDEIDIDSIIEIEEFELDQFVTMDKNERFDRTMIEYSKINQLVQAVKQLNKKVKELKEDK